MTCLATVKNLLFMVAVLDYYVQTMSREILYGFIYLHLFQIIKFYSLFLTPILCSSYRVSDDSIRYHDYIFQTSNLNF